MSDIPLEALPSPSQTHGLAEVRAAATHLLGKDAGLNRKQVAFVLGRPVPIIDGYRRRAVVELASHGTTRELVQRARELLQDEQQHTLFRNRPDQWPGLISALAALRSRAAQALPRVETRWKSVTCGLASWEMAPFPRSRPRTRLKHYDEAIEGILRREFPPDPNDRCSPRYFICPSGADTDDDKAPCLRLPLQTSTSAK